MKTVLYINFYTDKNPARNKELLDTLYLNCLNFDIDRIVAFVDANTEKLNHPKIKYINSFTRPTFYDLFNFINLETSPEQISIIANSDIHFVNGTLKKVKDYISPDDCYALARYDFKGTGSEKDLVLFNRSDAQDTWIFKGYIKPVQNCKFTMGVPGCDNAIAQRLKYAGYNVTNPSLDLKTVHMHKSEVRNYSTDVRVPPPYLTMWPHELSNIRLLHIGIFDEKEPQMSLRNALKKYSAFYSEANWRSVRANEYMTKHLDMGNFNTVFMQIQCDGVVAPSLLKKHSEKGIRFFNFNGDVRIPFPKWHFDLAPYCTTLMTNVDNVRELQEKGFHAEYFQIGYNEEFYKPDGPRLMAHPPVTFIANNHHGFPLSALRELVVDVLRKDLGPERFRVYGNGWTPAARDLNFKQTSEAAAYRASKMAINLSHVDFERYTSDRMFRIMACGCLCLAYRHKKIEEDFIDGVHLRTWSTIGELRDLIEHYLKPENDPERLLIASNGMRKVKTEFSWDHRIGFQFRNMLTQTKQHDDLD